MVKHDGFAKYTLFRGLRCLFTTGTSAVTLRVSSRRTSRDFVRASFFTFHVNYVVSGGLIFQLSGQHETFYAFNVRFARGASTSKKLESKSQRRTRLFVSLPWGPARHGGQRGSKRAMDPTGPVQGHEKHHTSSKCNQETVFIYS